MAILWCGGEDVDFPFGQKPGVSTSGIRAPWSRCSLNAAITSSNCSSTVFPGGGVTSCWFAYRFAYGANNNGGANQQVVGLVGSGTNKGLFVGHNPSPGNKLMLVKWDGTTVTNLYSESGASLAQGGNHRIDMQVVNYGTNATVNVYLDANLVITYTGDVTSPGVSSLAQVCLYQGNNYVCYISEIIVSSTDTRSLQGLLTLALAGPGTAQAWTNPLYSNINGTSYSDTQPTYTNTPGLNVDYTVNGLPGPAFTPRTVKQVIRAATSTTPSATVIKMGYNINGSRGYGSGSSKTPTAAFNTIEQYDATNPVSSAAWTASDIATLQLSYQSG